MIPFVPLFCAFHKQYCKPRTKKEASQRKRERETRNFLTSSQSTTKDKILASGLSQGYEPLVILGHGFLESTQKQQKENRRTPGLAWLAAPCWQLA